MLPRTPATFVLIQLLVVSASGCGERTPSTRIVGGSATDAQGYPWYVALVARANTGTLNVLCGASLISTKHILTAAHCFDGTPIGQQKDLFKAVFILENRCTPKYKEMTYFNKVVVHPQYNRNSLKNDIAVMTLEHDVGYTAVCLPPARPNIRGEATIVGYGNLNSSGSHVYPCVLQEARVRMISRVECLRTGNFRDIASLPNVVCAGVRAGGVDTCDGDSGGPLLRTNSAGRYFVQGITSFGLGCARKNFPGVYTDVSKYLNWIRRTTGINTSTPSRAQSTCFTLLPDFFTTWFKNIICNSTLPLQSVNLG